MTKNKDDENYLLITLIMEAAAGYLPIILLFAVGPLVIVYIYPMTFNHIRQTSNVDKTNVQSICYIGEWHTQEYCILPVCY